MTQSLALFLRRLIDDPSFGIYMIFFFMSMGSAGVAFCIGAFRWKSLQTGLRILVVLLFVGLLIDMYALWHIIINVPKNKIWQQVNHIAQFSFVVAALLQLGKDVLLSRLHRNLLISLYGCCLLWFAIFFFAPEWFNLPYFAPLIYLLLLFLVGETALEYRRTAILKPTLPETYIFFGFMVYSAGIVVMQVVKIFYPDANPSVIHDVHGVLALTKNYCLIRAFNRDAWNHKH